MTDRRSPTKASPVPQEGKRHLDRPTRLQQEFGVGARDADADATGFPDPDRLADQAADATAAAAETPPPAGTDLVHPGGGVVARPDDDPQPLEVNGRLGTDLGSLEVIKASARIIIPQGADDHEAVINEWVWTMGLSDLVGRMLTTHRTGRLASRAVIADLGTLAGQIEHARQVLDGGPTTKEEASDDA